MPLPFNWTALHKYTGTATAEEPHTHQQLQFSYVLSGEFNFAMDNTTYTVTSGQLFVIAAGTSHLWHNSPEVESKVYSIYCGGPHELLGGMEGFFSPLVRNKFWSLEIPLDDITPLIDQLLKIKSRSKICRDAYDYAMNLQLLAFFCEKLFDEYPLETISRDIPGNIIKVIEYIEKYYREPLSLAMLSSVACLSPSRFSAVFFQLTNKSPMQYVNCFRIGKAESLLVQSVLPQEIIAEKCGFNSLHYFCRMFKKINGTSPAAFRKRHKFR